MDERIQKILARAGLGSRRDCEALISAGRVTVNGKVAILGSKADPEVDRIMVDGRQVATQPPPVYVALYKPRGVLSTVDAPDPRPTVRGLVDLPGRIYPVGRLDVDSEGLVLMTNDGDLANQLTHPRYGHEKEYRVLVARQPDEEQLEIWRRGVVLEDGYKTAPAQVRVETPFGKGAWLRIVLKEGRKRQIREVGRQIGLPVVKIIRVRIGTLRLASLKPGEWRYLTPQEVTELVSPEQKPTQKGHPAQRKPKRVASTQKSRKGGYPTRSSPKTGEGTRQSSRSTNRPARPSPKKSRTKK